MAKRVEDKETVVSCLRNERIEIRFVPKANSKIKDPRHVLYGGMSENSTVSFVVPKLTSGKFVNILTDAEKKYLEEIMGLPENALSIYKREDNFWDDSNPNGISRVTLRKQTNYLDLSIPSDYIKYKILLANKDFIAPSLNALQKSPKVTYRFVIVEDDEDTKIERGRMTNTMECYKEFGKIENDVQTLRTVIETLTGRGIAKETKLEFMQAKINELIQADAKTFLKVVKDEYLPTKILIKNSIENGSIIKKGNYYYASSNGDTPIPLCESGEEPTLDKAAKYLNQPNNQELLFTLQAKLN